MCRPSFFATVVVTPLLGDLQTDLYLLELDDFLCQPQKGHAGSVFVQKHDRVSLFVVSSIKCFYSTALFGAVTITA
jgi:hypothetical protein